jgi:hypothetical protein
MDFDLNCQSLYCPSFKECANVADASLENRFPTWHKRLRHLNLKEIQKLRSEHPNIFNWTKEEEMLHKTIICQGCATGKMAAKPLRATGGASRPISRRGELVFVDLYFSNIPSAGGNTCALIVVDAYSKTVHTYFGKNKASTALLIKEWIDEMQQMKINIRNFSTTKSDGGGEFCSPAYLDILIQHGLIQEKSPPYSHVAVAEISIRTVKDNIRTFIEDSYTNLSRAAQWVTKGKSSNPYIFWTFAAKHACNVTNYLPYLKQSNDHGPRKSRYETFFR